MKVQQYLEVTGTTIQRLCIDSSVSYNRVHKHVRHGAPLGLDVAQKLEMGTGGLIKAAHVLGLSDEETPEALELLARLRQGQQAQQEAQS